MELVGNPLVLGAWVTCGQSVGSTVFVVNALSIGYPCPGRVIHQIHRPFIGDQPGILKFLLIAFKHLIYEVSPLFTYAVQYRWI